jgi:hypothetical protein
MTDGRGRRRGIYPLNNRVIALRLLRSRAYLLDCVTRRAMSQRDIAYELGVNRKSVREWQRRLNVRHVQR